jgi:hypothetical protein
MADVEAAAGAPAPVLDAATRAALEQLHDVVTPPPPSWLPQTWGWAALALVLVALTVMTVLRRRRRRAANLYRIEALAELARIEAQLAAARGDSAARSDALRTLPPLLKRVALAAWPRDRVASLTQSPWTAFLRANVSADLPEPTARLLDDLEYRSPAALAAISDDDARACLAAARQWIETHRVPA